MAFSYISEKTVFDAYRTSKTYMRSLDDPFEEWERIARNKPHPGIDSAYPKVTDGTTASIIQKTPRRIIQQIPTGKVKGRGWLPIVAGFIFQDIIIPQANAQYNLIQKCWSVVEKGLIYGSQSVHVPFIQKDGKFCVDMTVPYVKNVLYESGKVSAKDSNYIFLEAWYQPKDIEAIIDQERKLKKKSKSYESTWDLSVLEEIKDEISAKADEELTPSERKRQDGNKGGVMLAHALQRGVGATFYSIHPKSKKIVRRKKNKDPRGEIPVPTFYAGIDGSNPRGRGFVELVAPLQNTMDSDMQMFQFERALNLAPVTIKRGNWNKSQAKLVPNAMVDLGSDPTNAWEVLKRDSQALQHYAEIYGLNKSQLLNLLSSPDTSVSAEVGNPGFSKTDAGVKSLNATMSVDDNYIRKQFEAFFEEWAETAINLYFAERSGVEELQLDESTAEKLRKEESFAQELLSEDNKIRINYDTETEKLKFEVDASTSNMKDNAEQADKAANILELAFKYPDLQKKNGGPIDTDELANRVVVNTGLEDPEKVVPKPEQQVDEEGNPIEQPQEAQLTPEMVQQMIQQALQGNSDVVKQEQNTLKSRELDIKEQEAAVKAQSAAHDDALKQAQLTAGHSPLLDQNLTEVQSAGEPPELTEEDDLLIQELQDAGVPDEEIGKGLAMMQHGYPAEDILTMLGVTA